MPRRAVVSCLYCMPHRGLAAFAIGHGDDESAASRNLQKFTNMKGKVGNFLLPKPLMCWFSRTKYDKVRKKVLTLR